MLHRPARDMPLPAHEPLREQGRRRRAGQPHESAGRACRAHERGASPHSLLFGIGLVLKAE